MRYCSFSKVYCLFSSLRKVPPHYVCGEGQQNTPPLTTFQGWGIPKALHGSTLLTKHIKDSFVARDLCNGRTRSGLLTALPSDAVFGGQLGSGSDPPSCAGRSQQLRPSLRAELATVFSVKAILTETLYHRTGELSRTSPRLFASQSMGRKISATRAASPRWSSHAPMRSRCRTESSPHFMAA